MTVTKRSLDKLLTRLCSEYGIDALRISLGIIFIWFGVLKFFPGLSAAESIATRTISVLLFNSVPPELIPFGLALLETSIGIGLLLGVALRFVLPLLLFQMAGTLVPLFLFPSETFVSIPFVPTLEGQYIIKNLVLITAAIVIGATVRGGEIIEDPTEAKEARKRTDQKARKDS